MGRFFSVILPFLIAGAILFFPIYLEGDAYYDVNKRKFGFILKAYKVIKLFGGYVATYRGGLAVHISPKKAILVPYSDLDNERKRFSFVQTFRLKTLSLTTETGVEYLLPVSFFQIITKTAFLIIGKIKKTEHIHSRVWLTDGDALKISLNCLVYFNLFILLCNFIKFLKEKIEILWQKRTKKSTI